MTRLADFMTIRRNVTWTEQRSRGGLSRFEIAHSSSLDEMVWLLPKGDIPPCLSARTAVSPCQTRGQIGLCEVATRGAQVLLL